MPGNILMSLDKRHPPPAEDSVNTPPSVPETASLPETPSASFPIVGIGASAGGLAGSWYLMHIRPYRTLNNVIEGAVLTFVDITRVKQMEAPLAAATPSKPQVSGDLT